MPGSCSWLPALVLFENYDGNWGKYLDALYVFYKSDFLDAGPQYQGKNVGVKRLPIVNGKESSFWHLIQEGQGDEPTEDDRTPDLRRCERIRWPKPIIENSGDAVVRVWPNVRHTKTGVEKSICLWFEDQEYLVVLRDRKKYFLLWTAYPVTSQRKKEKLRKEFEALK